MAMLLCLMTLTSLSACKTHVVSADRVVTPIKSGASFTAPLDGVFMSEAEYQRVRRLVADKILELKTAK